MKAIHPIRFRCWLISIGNNMETGPCYTDKIIIHRLMQLNLTRMVILFMCATKNPENILLVTQGNKQKKITIRGDVHFSRACIVPVMQALIQTGLDQEE